MITDSKLTINIVSYQRYDETKRIIDSLLKQTHQNFIIDFWNDGIDDKKRKIIESYNNSKIIYNENEIRQNKYGHDMRHKSCMNCNTTFWCSANDDNVFSPYFVEMILHSDNINYDIIKISIAMVNWIGLEPQQDTERVFFIDKNNINFKEDIYNKIINGETNYRALGEIVPILKPYSNKISSVDVASFLVKTDFIKKIGGWKYLDYAADGILFEEMCGLNPKIKYIESVLEVHY